MNVLFLTMSPKLFDMKGSGIYIDLVNKFLAESHMIYVVAPFERRLKKQTSYTQNVNFHTLGVRTLNVTKCGIIEKGIGQILIDHLFSSAIKKYFVGVKFDLILYSTPPITFVKTIKYIKKHNPNVKTYLLLKDIFPQNAVDLNMLSKTGIKSIIYKYFRKKEKNLYDISDHIGCMSPANVKYVIEHNVEIDSKKVEIAPNSYALNNSIGQSVSERKKIRQQYFLPLDKPIFIYGGNMGKPQGISFLIECMKAVKDRLDCHFVIIGDGVDYHKLESWVNKDNPRSVSVYKALPKKDYDQLAMSCDVGLIFLDYRFTIPNYPSRLLPYLMNKKPIIAVTDPNCDVGELAEENGYGYYCPSNDVNAFVQTIDKILTSDIKIMGENGYQFYLNNYTIDHTYNAIVKHFM